MFQLRYVASELRRRAGRTVLTALGLAAGVGLVIGIIGVSQGLNDAQTKVLSPLSKVGTDVLVTRVAGAPASDGSAVATTTTTSTTATPNGFGGRGPAGGAATTSCVGGAGGFFAVGGGGGNRRNGGAGAATTTTTVDPNAAANAADCSALLSDNDTVLTDLSKLGAPGTQFTHDFFLPATLLTFPDTAIADVSKLSGVTSAVGGLTLLAQHETGTVPNISVNVTTAEQQISQNVAPAPMTPAEQAAFRTCLEAQGAAFGGGTGASTTTTTSTTVPKTTTTTAPPATTTTAAPTTTTTTAPPTTTTTAAAVAGASAESGPRVQLDAALAPEQTPPAGGDTGGGGRAFGGGGGGRGFDNSAFQDCEPQRFKDYQTNVVIPARQIQQIVNPPSTDTANSSYTAAGIDPNSPKAGLVTTDQLKTGRFINPGANNEVLLSVSYANKKTLTVGSTLPINGQTFNVVGLVDPALTGSTADIYFTLTKLQELSTKTGRINQVLVKVTNAGSVDKVAKEIAALLPGAQVVTSKSLSDQVTGSLTDAKKLADRLGGALAAIVLAAVFAIAMLLTLSSVAKRIREIGTLRAIGWSKNMVVRQVLFETVGIGLLGGIIGIIAGFGVSTLVKLFSPSFTATSLGVPGFGTSSLSGFLPTAAKTTPTTSTVHLTAPIHPTTLLIGVGFAILGGLLAGAVGGWRAARLSPAEALRNVG